MMLAQSLWRLQSRRHTWLESPGWPSSCSQDHVLQESTLRTIVYGKSDLCESAGWYPDPISYYTGGSTRVSPLRSCLWAQSLDWGRCWSSLSKMSLESFSCTYVEAADDRRTSERKNPRLRIPRISNEIGILFFKLGFYCVISVIYTSLKISFQKNKSYLEWRQKRIVVHHHISPFLSVVSELKLYRRN